MDVRAVVDCNYRPVRASKAHSATLYRDALGVVFWVFCGFFVGDRNWTLDGAVRQAPVEGRVAEHLFLALGRLRLLGC